MLFSHHVRTVPFFGLGHAIALLAILCLPCMVFADDQWRIQGSLHTTHFDPQPDHNNLNRLLSMENWRDDNWHGGLALFDNSYYQPSQYLYVGYSRDLDAAGRFYWRVTGGLVHGYKGEYEDKLPLNANGIAPIIIPSLGIRAGSVFGEVQLLGLAGAMLTLGYSWGD